MHLSSLIFCRKDKMSFGKAQKKLFNRGKVRSGTFSQRRVRRLMNCVPAEDICFYQLPGAFHTMSSCRPFIDLTSLERIDLLKASSGFQLLTKCLARRRTSFPTFLKTLCLFFSVFSLNCCEISIA